jgi:phosphoribosylglycinamide formyltransferase 1
MKIVFLGSGGGGNLKFIHNLSKINKNFDVVGVITDRHCGASEYAKKSKIFTTQHSFKRTLSENQILISILDELSPDIIITNVHKILSKVVVQNFKGRLINLHYSYLPAYAGLIGVKPVDAAIERGNKYIGVTCHEVNEKVDDGKTLAQGLFFVSESNNFYQSTFEIGAITLLAGLQQKLNIDVSTRTSFESSIVTPGIRWYSSEQLRTIFERLKVE